MCETGVLDLKPKLLGFHISGLATWPNMLKKKKKKCKEVWGRAEKGGLLHCLGHTVGRSRVSTQPIFSHLWGTDMSFSFK
jgi:hypothetical protein